MKETTLKRMLELDVNSCTASEIKNMDIVKLNDTSSPFILLLNDADFMTKMWQEDWGGVVSKSLIDYFDNSIHEYMKLANISDYWKAAFWWKNKMLKLFFENAQNKYKQIYELDDDFAKALIQTNDKKGFKLYLEELGTLPYNCFTIDVSKLSIFDFSTDDIFKTYGYIKNITVYPMLYKHDIESDGKGFFLEITLHMIIHFQKCSLSTYIRLDNLIENEEDHPYLFIPENETDSIPIGPCNENESLYHFNGTYFLKKPWYKTLNDLVFQTFVYLSSFNPDIEETKPSIKQKDRARRLKKPEPPTRYIVGRRYGTAIRLHKENEPFYEAYNNVHREIASSSKRAHTVKAHYHHFWIGPKGNQRLRKQWVYAYFTGDKVVDEVIHGTIKKPNGTLGEQKVKEYLNARGIKHKTQFYIPKTGRYYDEAILLRRGEEDVLCFIEFDGKQHFEQVQNWDFEKTKQSDKEKNQYVVDNSIPLCRIKYNQMGYISDILDDFINKVLSGEYNEEAFYNPYFTTEEYYK